MRRVGDKFLHAPIPPSAPLFAFRTGPHSPHREPFIKSKLWRFWWFIYFPTGSKNTNFLTNRISNNSSDNWPKEKKLSSEFFNRLGILLATFYELLCERWVKLSSGSYFSGSSSSSQVHRAIKGFFFTSVADSTFFVLFDLVRSFVGLFLGRGFFLTFGCGFYICLVWSRPLVLVSLSFTTGKFWRILGNTPKSGQHSNFFVTLPRILPTTRV